jgi:Lon-like protease
VPPTGIPRTRRRWPWVLGAFVALLVVAAIIAAQISVPYYVITPGDASPVGQYIEVPQADNHPISGNILLTDVFVSHLSALGYLQYHFFDSNNEIYSSQELLGPSTSSTEFVDQGYLEMTQAQSFATAAALSHLGYPVTSSNAGALIYGIVPGSPAAKTLKVAQVITAVNGTPTTSECGLIQALHGYGPGTTVTLSVEQSFINDVGTFVTGPVVQKPVLLEMAPKPSVVTFCGGPPITQTAFIGVEAETQQNWQFPVKVSVHTQDIGGPSAGLAMSLGIIDKLSSGRLTGGRVVAATGTIDQNGNVGDVGGVAEKTIAVERAGATVFFVPKVELKTAEAKASPQLHVYAVSNLDQVLRILLRLGGTVATNPVPAQAAS